MMTRVVPPSPERTFSESRVSSFENPRRRGSAWIAMEGRIRKHRKTTVARDRRMFAVMFRCKATDTPQPSSTGRSRESDNRLWMQRIKLISWMQTRAVSSNFYGRAVRFGTRTYDLVVECTAKSLVLQGKTAKKREQDRGRPLDRRPWRPTLVWGTRARATQPTYREPTPRRPTTQTVTGSNFVQSASVSARRSSRVQRPSALPASPSPAPGAL